MADSFEKQSPSAWNIAKGVYYASIPAMTPHISSAVRSLSGTIGFLELYLYVMYKTHHFEESSVARLFHENLKYVQFIERPLPEFLTTAYYYALMAYGIYQDETITKWEKEWDSGEQKWLQPLNKAAESVRERPRFAYYIDWYRRTLVIMVRGTSGVGDLLTDIEARSIDIKSFGDLKVVQELELCQPTVDAYDPEQLSKMWENGEHKVHYGFMCAARNILNDPCGPFSLVYKYAQSQFGIAEGDNQLPIYVTGHSLGGSTASCIVYMLRKNNYPAFGVVFAPAPTFSPAMLMDESDKCRDCIVSFVNRYDFVAHLEPNIIGRSVNIMLGKLIGDKTSTEPANRKAAEILEKQETDEKAAYANRVETFNDIFSRLSAAERAELANKDASLSVLAELDDALVASVPERRYYKAATITLASPGNAYWIHYYNAPKSNAPHASLWRILSHNFMDFLPFVYAFNTPNEESFMEANVGTDHLMGNYLKHLRILYHTTTIREISETRTERLRRLIAENAAIIAAADAEVAAAKNIQNRLIASRAISTK